MTCGPLDVEMGALAAGDPVLQAFAYVFASGYQTARAAGAKEEQALFEAEISTLRFRRMLRDCDMLAVEGEAAG